jgi:hypothetical protein
MIKFNIHNSQFNINNEIIKTASLESNSSKYILYSGIDIDEKNIDVGDFIKMEFKEDMQILPKKKFTELNLSIIKNNGINKLLYLDNPVYYLKDSKNPIIHDNLKIILSNGKLHAHKYTIPNNISTDLVSNILNKNKVSIKTNESNIVDNDLDQRSLEINNDDVDIEVEPTGKDIIIENTNALLEEITEKSVKIIEYDTIYVKNEVDESEVSNEVYQSEGSNEVSNEVLNEVTRELSNEVYQSEVSNSNIVEDIDYINVINNDIKEIEHSSNEQINIESNTNEITNQIINTYPLKDIICESTSTIIETDKINKENIVNEEKNEIDIIKPILGNEIFSFENILSDFNKLFNIPIDQIEQTNQIEQNNLQKNETDIKIETNTIENKNNIRITNIKEEHKKELVKNNEIIKPKREERTNIYNIYTLRINYNKQFYKISTIKLKDTPELNFGNLYKTTIYDCNIINNINISFELETLNSSYLILFFNQKYLIIKNTNVVIITNLQTHKSDVIKNNDNFKLGQYDYTLYNGTLLLSLINKKIFDNNYGTAYNIYLPRTNLM